jgi:hypothetical protein
MPVRMVIREDLSGRHYPRSRCGLLARPWRRHHGASFSASRALAQQRIGQTAVLLEQKLWENGLLGYMPSLSFLVNYSIVQRTSTTKVKTCRKTTKAAWRA